MARSHEVATSQTRLAELCERLSKDVGTVFYPYHAVTYRDLAEAMERGELGIACMPPIPAIDLHDRGRAIPLVLPTRRGSTTFHSAFIVKRNGPRSLSDLKGLRVAWVDRESAAGYLVPRMHLVTLGYDVRTIFSQEVFVQSHFGVVDAVLTGRVDVGATYCTVDPVTKRVVTAGWTAPDGSQARPVDVLTTVGPIPNDAMVASTDLPTDVRARVTRFLLQIDHRSKELVHSLLHADAFRVAAAGHFEPLRHIMRAASARGSQTYAAAREG